MMSDRLVAAVAVFVVTSGRTSRQTIYLKSHFEAVRHHILDAVVILNGHQRSTLGGQIDTHGCCVKDVPHVPLLDQTAFRMACVALGQLCHRGLVG